VGELVEHDGAAGAGLGVGVGGGGGVEVEAGGQDAEPGVVEAGDDEALVGGRPANPVGDDVGVGALHAPQREGRTQTAKRRFRRTWTCRARHCGRMRRLLVEMREERGLSREALAHRMGVSVRTVARWESGMHTPQMAQRVTLAEVLDRPLADVLRALDDHADSPLPPTYRAPTTGLDMLAMLEQSCRQMRTVELTIVPGLLQTADYAAAVEAVDPARPTAREITRRVSERLQRQRSLDRDDPLHLLALLDPSILREEIGGPAVMAAQLAHLREADAQPNVTIRLLTAAGRIAASNGPFKLLTGDDTDPFLVVTEDLSGGLSYRGGRSVVGVYNELWAFIWEQGSDALDQVELQQG
jgi:transcriptional regulator with XRE-family HTH domain